MSTYNQAERNQLLELAQQSIYSGIFFGKILKIDSASYSQKLQQLLATFVTLHLNDNLRGCIGSLQAHRPLVNDVIHNAYAAALQDHRFSPVTKAEYPNLDLSISVLSTPEPLEFDSQEDLLAKIRPKVDGLILTSGAHQGTFLPSVWEQLPDPVTFLQHLKNKAGLPSDYWSDNLAILRYTTEIFQQEK